MNLFPCSACFLNTMDISLSGFLSRLSLQKGPSDAERVDRMQPVTDGQFQSPCMEPGGIIAERVR